METRKENRLKVRADKKRELESRVIQEMISIYYKKFPNPQEEAELTSYALERVNKCPFMATKTFCSQCKVHCYQKKQREQIKQVMRYSGWRMLLRHPYMTICHLYYDHQQQLEKPLFLLIGFIGLFLSILGAILPVLPSFPFVLLTAFGFARSSDKLHEKFLASRLYQDNAKDWVEHRAMKKNAKKRVMITISCILLFSFVMMRRLVWLQWILFFVWLGHMAYFIYGIPNLDEE